MKLNGWAQVGSQLCCVLAFVPHCFGGSFFFSCLS